MLCFSFECSQVVSNVHFLYCVSISHTMGWAVIDVWQTIIWTLTFYIVFQMFTSDFPIPMFTSRRVLILCFSDVDLSQNGLGHHRSCCIQETCGQAENTFYCIHFHFRQDYFYPKHILWWIYIDVDRVRSRFKKFQAYLFQATRDFKGLDTIAIGDLGKKCVTTHCS